MAFNLLTALHSFVGSAGARLSFAIYVERSMSTNLQVVSANNNYSLII